MRLGSLRSSLLAALVSERLLDFDLLSIEKLLNPSRLLGSTLLFLGNYYCYYWFLLEINLTYGCINELCTDEEAEKRRFRLLRADGCLVLSRVNSFFILH